MKIIRSLPNHSQSPYPVLTIGNFDGQHVGHHALITAVVEAAQTQQGTPTVLTFDPHPIHVLRPGLDLQFLSTLEERLCWFQNLGIAEVVILPFTTEFASWSAQEFVLRILRDGIGVRKLLVGEHFVFGKDRSGTISDLVRLGSESHFELQTMSPIRIGGDVVSSTRIRLLLQEGQVREAFRYLGRLYMLNGLVVEGDRRGKQLGCPTANLDLPKSRVAPADGVYSTLTVWRNRSYGSISYIGAKPTFGPGRRTLEVHILDEEVSLYGEEIQVKFVERLRGDQVFSSAEELVAQMNVDLSQARESLKSEFWEAAKG